MGWYFNDGGSRKDLIAELVNGRTFSRPDGILVVTKSLLTATVAECFQAFFGRCFKGNFYGEIKRLNLPIDGSDAIYCSATRATGIQADHRVDGTDVLLCPLVLSEARSNRIIRCNESWRSQVIEYHSRQAAKTQIEDCRSVLTDTA